MLHVKSRFNTFAVFVILFVEICCSLDFRSLPESVSNHNNTASTLNVSNKESMTQYPFLGSTAKTWRVGRVSRKQYEIINMIWRKTNIFGDEDTTVPIPQTKNLVETLTTVPKISPRPEQKNDFTPTTMSYIEFYYMDEVLDPMLSKSEIKEKEEKKRETKMKEKVPEKTGQFKNFIPRPPLLSFNVGKQISKPNFQSTPSKNPQSYPLNYKNQEKIPFVETDVNSLEKFLVGNIAPRNVMSSPYTTQSVGTPTTKKAPLGTPDDKVKFFELYDSNTRLPVSTDSISTDEDSEIITEKMKELDEDLGYRANKKRFLVKHNINDNNIEQNVTFKSFFNSNNREETSSMSVFTETPTWEDIFNYTASEFGAALWSNYPFAAVYVYERLQVHCDAAAISPYWLVASAACLSRHRDNPNAEDRSAFITYCGDSWWNPERIAYVKYTLVHPRYSPRDTVRRHLYNIGVIQVANSMSSSCSNWAPVSIMSHQYITGLKGSLGSAVGWGLDRYDTSYSSQDLPRHPLAVYEGHIFSNSCPGNSGYRSTKDVSDEAVSNVYCLTLPNYAGEEKDPVHGGLLLVGGKLIALYLQEERRRWGEQSAQYTSVWRLIPWVLDVAKDPEEMDFDLMR